MTSKRVKGEEIIRYLHMILDRLDSMDVRINMITAMQRDIADVRKSTNAVCSITCSLVDEIEKIKLTVDADK